MRRFIIVVAAAGAILLPGLTVAAVSASAATPSNECVVPNYYVENISGAWLHVNDDASHTVIATKTASQTMWCVQQYGSYYRFEQYQTYRCMTIGSSRTIVSGDCNGNYALWAQNHSHAYGGNYKLLENDVNRACIYQNRLGDPVTYNPCVDQHGTTSDVWILLR